jgi:hypothetical protein
MAAEYVDPVTGVAEPGSLSGLTYDEFVDYVEAATQAGLVDDNKLTDLRPLAEALLDGQIERAAEVTLPTGQLFMENLTGDSTNLEPFKLAHRGLDVIAAEEEVRSARIDALRRTRRVAKSELERDPVKVDHLHLGQVPPTVLDNN